MGVATSCSSAKYRAVFAESGQVQRDGSADAMSRAGDEGDLAQEWLVSLGQKAARGRSAPARLWGCGRGRGRIRRAGRGGRCATGLEPIQAVFEGCAIEFWVSIFLAQSLGAQTDFKAEAFASSGHLGDLAQRFGRAEFELDATGLLLADHTEIE